MEREFAEFERQLNLLREARRDAARRDADAAQRRFAQQSYETWRGVQRVMDAWNAFP